MKDICMYIIFINVQIYIYVVTSQSKEQFARKPGTNNFYFTMK